MKNLPVKSQVKRAKATKVPINYITELKRVKHELILITDKQITINLTEAELRELRELVIQNLIIIQQEINDYNIDTKTNIVVGQYYSNQIIALENIYKKITFQD